MKIIENMAGTKVVRVNFNNVQFAGVTALIANKRKRVGK